jgi:hypothetical protein
MVSALVSFVVALCSRSQESLILVLTQLLRNDNLAPSMPGSPVESGKVNGQILFSAGAKKDV